MTTDGQARTGAYVVLVWTDEMGYRCPACSLYVCVPKREHATCPRCVRPGQPLDEAFFDALTDEGLDETDAEAATKAVMRVLASHNRDYSDGES